MSESGPKLPFTAMQRYVRSWSTSRHGADIVSVPPQPRNASLNGGEPSSNSDSWAMFAVMRHASSRVRRCAAERSSRLVLEIDVGQRLPAVVPDDEASAYCDSSIIK
jgi:hypothetical protein